MDIKKFLEDLIAILPPYCIESVEKIYNKNGKDVEHIEIYVKLDSSYVPPEGWRIHSWQERRWQHLSFFEYPCYIICKVPFLQNKQTKETKLLAVPWARPYSGFTLLFEYKLLSCLKETHNIVARMFGLYPQRVEYVYNAYTQEPYEQRKIKETVRCLGIDETSSRKGHEYITVFVDMETQEVIDVEPGKDSQSVALFLQKAELSDAIEEVSMDMSPAFVHAVQTQLPKSKITFDKFHVYRHIYKHLNLLPDREEKDFALSELDMLYTHKDKESMAGFLAYWIEYIREYLKAETLAKSLKRHFAGIVQYAHSQLNNGLLEGINTKIQMIKRIARGYRYKDNFARMILFSFGKIASKFI